MRFQFHVSKCKYTLLFFHSSFYFQMNATRSLWSKALNCCRIRKTPEVIFLVCTGIISVLPLFYYLVLRYFSPIRDLPNVLKRKYLNTLQVKGILLFFHSVNSFEYFLFVSESRFKQTILRSLGRSN